MNETELFHWTPTLNFLVFLILHTGLCGCWSLSQVEFNPGQVTGSHGPTRERQTNIRSVTSVNNLDLCVKLGLSYDFYISEILTYCP